MNSYEQAYIEGFSKVAESYGVDPAILLKKAGLGGAILRGMRYLPRLARSAMNTTRQVGQDVGNLRRLVNMPGSNVGKVGLGVGAAGGAAVGSGVQKLMDDNVPGRIADRAGNGLINMGNKLKGMNPAQQAPAQQAPAQQAPAQQAPSVRPEGAGTRRGRTYDYL